MSESSKLVIDRAFTRMANWIAGWAGSPEGFAVALAAMILWALTGPLVGYSELWQLSVNTGTTIITFLMVFIIQNSQNRDTRAIQIKIDELIRATKGASNSLLDLEILSATEIDQLYERYQSIAARAKDLGFDFETGSPDVPTAEEMADEVRAAKEDEAAKAADEATRHVADSVANEARPKTRTRRKRSPSRRPRSATPA